MKKALITGISGQDGSYLAELLLDKGYEVHALLRRTSNDPTSRLQDIFRNRTVNFHYGDIRDLNRVSKVMSEVVPDEVYNLAAQSHVGVSFECPEETWDIDYYGVGRVVNEAVKANPKVRIYQASTSEMFGNSPAPQNEKTPFDPQSPYAEAKVMAHQDFIVNKREKQGVFSVSGILFNHESPRRGKQFVTRKITHSFAKIAAGIQTHVELGNLDAKRDWGFAGDYVEAMHLILQQDTPDDYVIATGQSKTVREFVEVTAVKFGYEIEWSGEQEKEIGVDKKSGDVLVKINPKFYRPAEVHYLEGDASKAKTKLGWEPKHSFEQLVEMMVKHDIDLVSAINHSS